MRKPILLIFACLCNLLLQGQKKDTEVRDKAIENTASVLFDTKTKEMRTQLKKFENQTEIKLHYKVDEQSLDQIGGLSEYLFKVFQSITSPINTNVKTIVGEFSTVQNQQLTDTVSYQTSVTYDLRNCLYPAKSTIEVDSFANNRLRSAQKIGNNYNESPESLQEYICHFTTQYANIYNQNRENCGATSFEKANYESHVIHTRASRAQHWTGAITALSNRLLNGEDLRRSNIDTTFSLAEDAVANPIISINNAIDACSMNDLQTCSGLLFKETGLRYLFITAGIEFLLPQDSMQLFANKITEALYQKYPTGNFVIGIWLKCHDDADEVAVPLLLVSQNGNFLTKADIEFARNNNTRDYTGNAFNVYKALYRNIPKPLHVCYQVAKANGYLSTLLLHSPQLVKGKEQIFVHVFKHDRVFYEVKELDRKRVEAAIQNADCRVCPQTNIQTLIDRKAALLSQAILHPKLTEAQVHFSQRTLMDARLAEEAAKKWLESEFDLEFEGTQTAATQQLEDNYIEGSCKTSTGDLIGDRLMVASLLLSPTGLDMVVDAVAVLYYSSKGEYLQATLSGAAMFMPGNLNALNRTAKNLENALDDLIHGSQIIKSQTGTEVILGEQIAVLCNYGIAPKDYQLLAGEISTHLSGARKLLPTEGAETAIYSTVRQLPIEKRTEFLSRCLYDEAFASNCLKDVEEVWKWAGYLDLETAFINGWNKESVKSLAKGARPKPFDYLREQYIKSHLSKFEKEGVCSRLVAEQDYLTYGIGKPDAGKTEFVGLKSEIDKILALPAKEQAEILGVPLEQLEKNKLVRIDFKLSKDKSVTMPTGNEFGANSSWIPGGKLPTGLNEAVIRTEGMKKNIDYIVTVLN